MKLFKAEDFEELVESYIARAHISHKANEIFERWLDSQQTVYRTPKYVTWYANDQMYEEQPQWKAKLVAIEPIKPKCEHPEDKVMIIGWSRLGLDGVKISHPTGYECQCGAKVKPTKFEAAE